MSKIIVASTNPTLTDKIKSIIGSFASNFELIIINNKTDLLNTKEECVIIIDFNNKEFENQVNNITKIIDEREGKILLILNDLQLEAEQFKTLEDYIVPHDFKLLDFCAKLGSLLNTKRIEYFPIEIQHFLKISKFTCETYIRIGKSNFIKIANQDDEITNELLNHYRAKKLNLFYVHAKDFFTKCNSLFNDNIVDKTHFPTKEQYAQKSHEILHNMIKDMGINEFVISNVNETLKDVEKSLNNPKLKEVFELFNRSKGTFLYDHSYLTLTFSLLLCKHMNWENPQNREKLSLACMLHDLAISDPKIALHESTTKDKFNEIEDNIVKKIESHSEVMATLLEKDPDIPQEVINIVRKHHEGLGPEQSWPKGLNGVNLTQLECLFIIAHGFTLELYKYAFNPLKIKQAMKSIIVKYNSGNFKTLHKALEMTVTEDIKPQF